jgi:hypothetical protein
MVDYRAYVLDKDGHIIKAEPLSCESDDEAVTAAQLFVDGHDVEIWQRARFIRRLPRKNNS